MNRLLTGKGTGHFPSLTLIAWIFTITALFPSMAGFASLDGTRFWWLLCRMQFPYVAA
jgi:hypothetical protein